MTTVSTIVKPKRWALREVIEAMRAHQLPEEVAAELTRLLLYFTMAD